MRLVGLVASDQISPASNSVREFDDQRRWIGVRSQDRARHGFLPRWHVGGASQSFTASGWICQTIHNSLIPPNSDWSGTLTIRPTDRPTDRPVVTEAASARLPRRALGSREVCRAPRRTNSYSSCCDDTVAQRKGESMQAATSPAEVASARIPKRSMVLGLVVTLVLAGVLVGASLV